jgi:hypothetical protein
MTCDPLKHFRPQNKHGAARRVAPRGLIYGRRNREVLASLRWIGCCQECLQKLRPREPRKPPDYAPRGSRFSFGPRGLSLPHAAVSVPSAPPRID